MFEHLIEGCHCEGKHCNKCKVLLCYGAFAPRKAGKLKLNSSCRTCTNAQRRLKYSPEKRRADYEAHIDYERERNREYARVHKEEVNARARERYEKNRDYELARRKRRYQRNKEHEKQRNKRWRQANLERSLATSKAWREANVVYHRIARRNWRLRNAERDRANLRNWRNAVPGRISAQHSKRRAHKALSGGFYTATEWEDLKAKYNYTCLCCGRKEPEINLTADHITPVTKMGSSYIWNIQPLCKPCNSSKNIQIIDYRPLWKGKEA